MAIKNDNWSIYIVQCNDGTLYTGITKDINRRLEEHNDKTVAKYTRSRGPVKLVYEEQVNSRSDALKREYQIKALPLPKKVALIMGE